MTNLFKILFLTILLNPLLSSAQKISYSLNVQVKEVLPENSKLYLIHHFGKEDAKIIDSALLQQKSFSFQGELNNPIKVTLVLDQSNNNANDQEKENVKLFLENGKINVLSNDLYDNAEIKGGKLNETFDQYKKNVSTIISNEFIQLKQDFRKLTQEEQADPNVNQKFMDKVKKLALKDDSLNLDFIQRYPNDLVSLELIEEQSFMDNKRVNTQKLFNSLDPSLQDSEIGKTIKIRIYNNGYFELGSLALDFTQNDVNGNPVKLSSFRGKYVLIDFWASWCAPCRRENPNVVKAFEKFKSNNFTVLGVSLDLPGKKEDWIKAIEDDGLTWTHVSDLNGWSNAVAKLYGIRAIPHNILIDPEGKILAINLFGDSLTDFLTKNIKTTN